MSVGLLQLQVDEMLSEVHSDKYLTKHSPVIKTWIDSLIQALKCPSHLQLISPSWLQLQGITALSFRDPQATISFIKPHEIQMVGSFPLNLTTNPYLNIDIAVQLPQDILNQRDILNYSYFDKRNLYIGAIFHTLSRETQLTRNISFAFLKGDIRKPILVLQPNIKTSFTIRLIITAPEGIFKLSQLRPSKNNVRPSWWIESVLSSRNDPSKLQNINSDSKSLPPTPNYNMAIFEDVMILKIHDFIVQSLDKSPFLRNIIILVKIWLTQRGFRWGIDSLDGHCAILLILHLYLSGRIATRMTPLTGFMAFLKLFSEMNLNEEVVNLGNQVSFHSFPIELILPIQNGEALISYNVLWRLTKSSLQQLQEQAIVSLQTFQVSSCSDTTISTSIFRSIFLQQHLSVKTYDMIVHLHCVDREEIKNHPVPQNDAFLVEVHQHLLQSLDDLTPWQSLSSISRNLIQKALGDRALKVHSVSQPMILESSSIHSAHLPIISGDEPPSFGRLSVSIGIVFNESQMYRKVDRGPSATDEVACQSFKRFWGPKSEMRQFKDGSIIEAVVWTETKGSSLRGERLTATIVEYILQRHMPFHSDLLGLRPTVVSGQIAELLPDFVQQLPPVSETSFRPDCLIAYSTKSLFRRSVEAMDILRRIVTSDLKEFPLVIESLRPTHSFLRYTSLFPPRFNLLATQTQDAMRWFSGEKINTINSVIPVIVQLQKSSRWPSDLVVVRSLKSALLIRLSDCLERQFSIRSVVHSQQLDVFFEGYIFRLFLFSDIELSLLSPEITGSDDIDRVSIREKCSIECSTFYRLMITSPQHHLAIHTLCSRYDSYSDAVRLLTLWFDLQYVSGYVEHEVIELIVASVYVPTLSQLSHNSPHSATAGFIAALDKLAEFEWIEHPLTLDLSFNSETSSPPPSQTDIDYIYSEFSYLRKLQSGGPSFVIAAKYESSERYQFGYGMSLCDQSIFNLIVRKAQNTSQSIVSWVQSFASEKYSIFSLLRGMDTPIFDVQLIFIKTAISAKSEDGRYNYDILMDGQKHSQVEFFQNIKLSELSDRIVGTISCGPHQFQTEYFQKISRKFSHLALFFYNQLDGDKIGIVWKPNSFFPHHFSALQSLHQTVSTSGYSFVNTGSVISEIVALGEGIVDKVIFR